MPERSSQPRLLEAVFDHLVLPPRLPVAPETDSMPLNRELTARFLDACKQMKCRETENLWDTVEASLLLTQHLNRDPASKESLAAAFSQVAQDESVAWLVLHAVQQNAVIIIHKNNDTNEVVFEAFEASPTAPAVLEANHALQWTFPGRSAAVAESEFSKDAFQHVLAEFLEQASEVALDKFAARSSKGGGMVVEPRDTPSPALITEMLMSFLEATGRPFPVHAVQKRIRDDVVLRIASETPWRRSPYWLALRVAVQRILLTSCGDDLGTSRVHFKFAMCVVLAHLLTDCQPALHPEKTLMLQAKLCRRLAKLQTAMSEAPVALRQLYEREFSKTRSFFESTVANAKRAMTTLWHAHKRRATRPIPLLPVRAPSSDLVLKLQNSRSKLQSLLTTGVEPPKRQGLLGPPSLAEGTVSQVDKLATQCCKLIVWDSVTMSVLRGSFPSPEAKCIKLSSTMLNYMKKVGYYYRNNEILMSQYLLNLFELWVAIDSLATTICPLLRDYHPVFVPEAIDMLCLMTRNDMERLRHVQRYISDRIKRCKTGHGTIFSHPGCTAAFPATLFRDNDDSFGLQPLSSQIGNAYAKSAQAKKIELDQLMARYEELSDQIQQGVCCCSRMQDGRLFGDRCERCRQARRRKRLKIMVHEAFLPEEESAKAAILLELNMPEYLCLYRDATWALRMLGVKEFEESCANTYLEDLKPLREFEHKNVSTSITLASHQKSFLQTHYRKQKMPKSEDQVLLPFGPDFAYYDQENCIWPHEHDEAPWYHHLLGSWLPESILDPFADASLYMDNSEHPSSYEIAAHQDACPRDMSPHEYTAYQRAISGVYRRWIVLVSELGSTNLNPSSDTTFKFFTRLALQSGPDQTSEILGKVHYIFHDAAFCERLEHQIRLRLNALRSGRKDLICMSTLTTLSLRLHNLCPSNFRSNVAKLLRQTREVLSLWISQLRDELRHTDNGETARKAAHSAFGAAMLYRQTFDIFLAPDNEPRFGEEEALHFFRASIALSENLIVNLDDVPPQIKQLLVQDMTRAYSMSDKIRAWTLSNFSALETVINETWTDAGSTESRSFSEWSFLNKGHWMASRTVGTGLVASQTVHYHALQGHLLIDGKPLGRLPLKIRDDKNVLELFQGQHLLTRPSGMAGMEYQIVNSVSNHDVHVGIRKGKVVIRAKFRGYIMEHVPREIFKGDTVPDLPSGLVDGCVHWLNLRTGTLEMRRKPNIWSSKSSNWVLNVRTRMATRQQKMGLVPGATTAKDGTCLVEPQSEVGKKIMHIFENFENPGNLTIYQPLSDNGRLSVEIKRLEMRFFVKTRGLLYSQQLQSEIDPVQDIGTLYGLESKLVLRNASNSRRKSVMVPIGPLSWERQGPHVSVKISNEGTYALFTVDPLLGRLNCAPEPSLLYMKALIHAITSFPIPDELTGRTGTEEACLCLTAAQSQPWKPLGVLPKTILSAIIALSPRRIYYPEYKRLYQKAFWDKSLTATIQHEYLAIHAGDILRQSQALDIPEKATDEQGLLEMDLPDLHHLALRGIIRRQVYERNKYPWVLGVLSQANDDRLYIPRGSSYQSKESTRVYRVIKELREGSGAISELPELSPILEEWRNIDGFNGNLSTLDIQRNLNAHASQAFGPLITMLRCPDGATYYIAQMTLALYAFGEQADAEAIAWLVAVANNGTMRDIEPPNIHRFTDFSHFPKFNKSHIEDLLSYAQDSYSAYVSARVNCDKGPKPRARMKYKYEICIAQEADSVASWLEKAWPDVPLTFAQFVESWTELEFKYTDVAKVWECLGPELQRLSQNLVLSDYVQSLEDEAEKLRNECSNANLASQRALHTAQPSFSTTRTAAQVSWTTFQASWATLQDSRIPPQTSSFPRVVYHVPCLTKVFRNSRGKIEIFAKDSRLPKPSRLDASGHSKDHSILNRLPRISEELSMLHQIVQPFKAAKNLIKQQYGQDLKDSIAAMAWDLEQPQLQTLELAMAGLALTTGSLEAEIAAVEKDLREKIILVENHLSSQDACYFWLEAGHLWPGDSLAAILEQLRLDNFKHLSLPLKKSLVQLGILVTKLQQLLRMQDAERCGDKKKLLEEKNSTGHSNWTPMIYPEWLLLEIDNNILIRPLQVEVAKAIISPQSEENSVLQMNMGKGKTSVVMPMAALILADKTKLCRIVVPKALLLQTAQVIQSRIGGLVGRQVRHVPFARRSPSDAATLSRYRAIHEEMQVTGGVMICLPAHILSFKLSGMQRLTDGQQKVGKEMVEIQRWLDITCRDILDESDLTLSVQTQLIYPSGDFTVVDGHPYRWLVVEELLSLVEKHASSLQDQFDGKIVVVQRHRYPIIHFLTTKPEDALNELLIDDVCNGRLPRLQIQESSSDNVRCLRQIISGAQVSSAVWDNAIKSLKDEAFGPKILYLLRGLISERILLLCLKKKWNIQYGLHPERQPIAVPFEAKGVPSQAAEYGHPDTALILTCLAFYQQGLSKEQVKQGLQGIMQSDDPVAHYDRWICSCASLPSSLRYWNSVDLGNDLQVETLWGYLRFDRTVINHHLNTYVFPVHAKQFSVKIQASGWDIPLLQSDLLQPIKRDGHDSLTTGFSGTNDNKRMLPQTIKQDDLPKLLCTNAEVLCHLLESRNKDCHLAAKAGIRFDEKETLKFLCDKGIRILIDAGAHILEMQNEDVAKTWLDIDTQAQGAVYFGPNGQIMVRSRFRSQPMPLIASPFANDLKTCVVYIDEGHTRGTDLKLPVEAKGAVTLGSGQTKDQTVQAAMRLRQLGTTQSVAFLAPPEVYRSILDVRRAHTHEPPRHVIPTSVDVVRWLLEQSCKANEQMMALHFSQCQDFCRRTDIVWKHPNFATNKTHLEKVLEVIRNEEQQTLQLMYGPRTQSEQVGLVEVASRRLQTFALNVADMARHGQSSCSSALMEVEQEREVVFEVEQVREKQKRTEHTAHEFPGVDHAIMVFITTGQLDTKAAGQRGPLMQAFDYVGSTKIGKQFGVKSTSSRFYVSWEYTRTIKVGRGMARHEILRPVHWILWNPSSETALLIIPEEADAIMPVLRNMDTPLVWLLGYTAPVTKSMQVFNCLSYLAVPNWPRNSTLPTWLSIEVGILSGRLYFKFLEYNALLSWLGVHPDEQQSASSMGIRISEPLQFLQEWVTYRRQTDDILNTPVGFVCQRQHLHEGHFFFLSHEANYESAASISSDEPRLEETDEDGDADDTESTDDAEE
ncbi:uncharacterized protein G6M90_00g066920 [Metarhizium brunneum]|uniref:ubiquitinyl hydrolase 1 n=1 Tax=Metarhizium brunneum TaxID=500148 RepID=A0A7D5Z4L5_9HYPO